MTYAQFKKYIQDDIYRYTGEKKLSKAVLIWGNAGLRYTIIMRFLCMARQNFIFWPFFFIIKFYFNHMSVKYGIDIPYNCKIGPGLYIGHFGGIIVNQDVVIGKNCNVNHGVTIGVAYGGKYPGYPKIGNNVFIGAGCKVFGGIEVGDDAAIGANCVVTQSVPPLGIIVGVPGKVISFKGSGAYVVNTI